MATIRQLKSGRYNVQVRREGHPPLSDTFETKGEAQRWARKIEGDMDEGRHFGYSRVRTLADAIDKAANDIKTADDRSRHLSGGRRGHAGRAAWSHPMVV